MGTLNINHELDDQIFNTINPLDPEEFRRQGHKIVNFLADYYQNIEQYPVCSQVNPGYLQKIVPNSAPNNPESLDKILKDVERAIIPGLTHWQSPNFFAYFPSSGSTAGFLGEMLSVGFNVVGFNWISSPAATELESIVMDWFGKMLNLPNCFLFASGGGGVLQGTTCEAMLCTIVAARDQMLRKISRENFGKLVVYASDQTHFSLKKAAHIGTTSTTSVDPLRLLCEIAKEFGIWVHIDAAYAGSACICPEFQVFLDGVENANSFSLNAHKWFFSTLDCCCLWVKDPSALTNALSTNPECLRNKATELNQVIDYKDWQIALSRRFRALKLWLVLRSYGVTNLRNLIRSHVNMAKHFEGLIATDKRFEIFVPRKFAMVCFRISPLVLNEKEVNMFNTKLVESINSCGKLYLTHGVVGGTYIIRFAIGASLTHYRHVDVAWKVIQDHANALLNQGYV
ncbi:hypothetical protein MTR67_011685 [Solanum verrucosum]|uniref:Tyrosine decarboxylase n=1 Tax=Solanum verrucosum TaxID=315347 RepID=A0AAF0QBJ2_SOLVR|nr:hypothetical protein MTR67_011685 [Solanum verrucosum]